MFHQFAKLAESGMSVTLTVTAASDGRLAVSVLPKQAPAGKDDKTEAITLKPFTVTGTPDELNSGFVKELKSVGKYVTGLVTNINEFAALVKKETAAVAKKAEKTVTSAKKTAKAAPTPAVKKEAPAASSQQNIFEDI